MRFCSRMRPMFIFLVPSAEQPGLERFHESAKKQGCGHHDNQRGRLGQLILGTAVFVWFYDIGGARVRNFENQSKGNRASDHAAVANKYEFFKRNRLLLETQPEQVEDTEDSNDSSDYDDEELKDAPDHAPVARDCRVQ